MRHTRSGSLTLQRNDIQHFQEGLFVLDIPTFSERVVRESVLNAVSHRDYQLGGSVFIRQHPRRLILESPGGFPVGITEQNILDRQLPRNRRITDIFAKCGLVEKGVVERFGRGRGVKYILSRRYYKMVDEKGAYTRKKGLDRETNKALLLKHIKDNRGSGSRLKELMQVLPALTMPQVQTFLRELKSGGEIHKVGRTRGALWYPDSETDTITSRKNG